MFQIVELEGVYTSSSVTTKEEGDLVKIIIDGCDFTGKTTLINALRIYFTSDKLSYLHFSYNDRRDYEFYNTILDKKNFIADRHFLDEAIYPEVFNRVSCLSENEFETLINKCKNENIKIIILTCSNEELEKRSKQRGNEEEEVLNNLIHINNKFIELAKQYNLQVFDTTINSLSDIMEYIKGGQI